MKILDPPLDLVPRSRVWDKAAGDWPSIDEQAQSYNIVELKLNDNLPHNTYQIYRRESFEPSQTSAQREHKLSR